MVTNQQIKREISLFNPFLESLTYTSLMVFSHKIKSSCFNGYFGIGKSRSSVELIKLLDIPKEEYSILSGYITPMGFYELLHEHKENKILILDESFSILNSNQQISSLLRSALYGSSVCWYSSKPMAIPLIFTFNGYVIFNTNKIREDINIKAVIDRTHYFNIKLDRESILKKILNKYRYKPNIEIWKEINKRVIDIRNKDIQLTNREMKFIYNCIRDFTNDDKTISVRLYEKAINIYKFCKLFYKSHKRVVIKTFKQLLKDLISYY